MQYIFTLVVHMYDHVSMKVLDGVSFHWAHMPGGTFSHAAAHIYDHVSMQVLASVSFRWKHMLCVISARCSSHL